MDDKTRMLAILAALTGCQGTDAYRVMAKAALRVGVTPVEIKEVTYQAVAYLGIGRVLPFFAINNEILKEDGVSLPLEAQAKTTMETRLEAGIQAQVDIFGDGHERILQVGAGREPSYQPLAGRQLFWRLLHEKRADYLQREMITFCFICGTGWL